jgi:hypothetical protein
MWFFFIIEAEYAFARDKMVIPVLLQNRYRPDGWLGILIGSKKFYDFSGKTHLNRTQWLVPRRFSLDRFQYNIFMFLETLLLSNWLVVNLNPNMRNFRIRVPYKLFFFYK